MNLYLSRIFEEQDGLYGFLSFDDYPDRLWTMERPWQGNTPFTSCVPCGRYLLQPHQSTRHGDTFALVGDTVSHWSEPGKPRSAILFHAANFPSELEGCIGLGMMLSGASGYLVDSREAMETLRRIVLPDEENWLTIGGPRG